MTEYVYMHSASNTTNRAALVAAQVGNTQSGVREQPNIRASITCIDVVVTVVISIISQGLL